MTKGLSLKFQAAAAYALAFLAAIAWIEVRFGLWSHGVNLAVPYVLLIVATILSASAFSGLFKGEPGSRARSVRLILVPMAIATTALYLTSVLLGGLAIYREASMTQLDFIRILPIVFIREAWLPLLAGLPAATWYLDVRCRRARHP